MININMKKAFYSVAALMIAAKAGLVLAAGEGGTNPPGKTSIELTNPLGTKTFGDLLKSVIQYAIEVSAVLLVMIFLWGGFIILTAGGDKSKFEQGKTILKNGAIGMVVVLAASGIVFVIGSLLGVDLSKSGI